MTDSLEVRPGILVECEGKRYTLTQVLDLEAVLAKDQESGKTARLSIKDLVPAREKPLPKPHADVLLGTVDEEAWQEASRRFRLILPLLDSSRRTATAVKEQARVAGVHFVTIYRWIDSYERGGRVSSLLPRSGRGGPGKRRLRSDVEEILKATVDEFHLTKQKRKAQKTAREVERRCCNAGLPPPHPNTVRNRIAEISGEVRVARREGAKAARDRFAPIEGSFPGADFPLAVVQIDHTPVDLILVDDIHRLPVGRPWITVAIDVFSRMILGFYISFDPPGAMSAGLCIAHAILPKETWLAKRGITTSWPCWGTMRSIHVDNAKEFRGRMLARACQEYGIDISWRPVARPHYGGHIERLLGTLASEIHTLPGTTFSNPAERGDYDSDRTAAVTFSEFEAWLVTFITGVYHQRIHSTVGTSPIHQYERGIFGTPGQPGCGLPSRILDEDRLRLDFMPFFERTIQPYGVAVDGVHYQSDVLRRFINAVDPEAPERKRRFVFKRDPRDISVIYFFDPELKQYSAVPYRDTSRPPISVWELREATRRLKQEGTKAINEDLIFESYERMREQEEQSVRATKRARLAATRRAQHETIDKPAIASKPAALSFDGKIQIHLDEITPFDELEELA